MRTINSMLSTITLSLSVISLTSVSAEEAKAKFGLVKDLELYGPQIGVIWHF